jgi:hypothetical protein
VRVRAWPRWSAVGIGSLLLLAALAVRAGLEEAWAAGAILGVAAIALGFRIFMESARATAAVVHGLDHGRADSA